MARKDTSIVEDKVEQEKPVAKSTPKGVNLSDIRTDLDAGRIPANSITYNVIGDVINVGGGVMSRLLAALGTTSSLYASREFEERYKAFLETNLEKREDGDGYARYTKANGRSPRIDI